MVFTQSRAIKLFNKCYNRSLICCSHHRNQIYSKIKKKKVCVCVCVLEGWGRGKTEKKFKLGLLFSFPCSSFLSVFHEQITDVCHSTSNSPCRNPVTLPPLYPIYKIILLKSLKDFLVRYTGSVIFSRSRSHATHGMAFNNFFPRLLLCLPLK